MKKWIVCILMVLMAGVFVCTSVMAESNENTNNGWIISSDGEYKIRIDTNLWREIGNGREYTIYIEDASSGKEYKQLTYTVRGYILKKVIAFDYAGFGMYKLRTIIEDIQTGKEIETTVDCSEILFKEDAYTVKLLIETHISNLKQKLKRPKTFELEAVKIVYGLDENGESAYFMEMTYTAENSYGDTVRETDTYYSAGGNYPRSGVCKDESIAGMLHEFHYGLTVWLNTQGKLDPKVSESRGHELEEIYDYVSKNGYKDSLSTIEEKFGEIVY